MRKVALATVLIAMLFVAAPFSAPAKITITRVLFLYGSVPPGTDAGDMIRIGNAGRNGYSQLAELLHSEQGHNLTELQDTNPLANPLTDTFLAPYDLVVLGSNNRVYSAAEAAAVYRYVERGGALLALSDSRFGLSPNRSNNSLGAGEISDNSLVEQFGMHIEHDNYQVVVADSGRFADPAHPVLSGLSSIKGEGVSLIRISGKSAQILVRGNGLPLTDGVTITGGDYAIVAIAQVGRGRVAATFDRNTFFNAGVGSDGTDISEHDNRAYAYNLFNWLARPRAAAACEGTSLLLSGAGTSRHTGVRCAR